MELSIRATFAPQLAVLLTGGVCFFHPLEREALPSSLIPPEFAEAATSGILGLCHAIIKADSSAQRAQLTKHLSASWSALSDTLAQLYSEMGGDSPRDLNIPMSLRELHAGASELRADLEWILAGTSSSIDAIGLTPSIEANSAEGRKLNEVLAMLLGLSKNLLHFLKVVGEGSWNYAAKRILEYTPTFADALEVTPKGT